MDLSFGQGKASPARWWSGARWRRLDCAVRWRYSPGGPAAGRAGLCCQYPAGPRHPPVRCRSGGAGRACWRAGSDCLPPVAGGRSCHRDHGPWVIL